jgi:O-antigen ligase
LAIGWQLTRAQPGFQPLLLAAMPWIVALIEGRRPVLRTRLDPWLVIFTATVLLGYWASYNRIEAISRLWLILLGILIFYIIAHQPLARVWSIFHLGALIGAFFAAYFLFSFFMQYLGGISAGSGIVGMVIRLFSRLPQIQPNIAGGVVAMLFPLSAASLVVAFHNKEREKAVLHGSLTGLMIIGLIMTSSRGAWFALAFGCLAGIVWGYAEMRSGRLRSGWIAAIFIVLVLIAAGWVIANASDQLPILLDSIVPGAASAQSRVELARNSLKLLEDTPFTGSGLGSFPGLYSRYILVISNFYFGYAHNLFLDIALAQSPFGLLAFLAILIVGMDAVIRSPKYLRRGLDRATVIRAALLASFFIILVHGLVDDPIYSGRGVVLLFFIPGLALAVHEHLYSEQRSTGTPSLQTKKRTSATTAIWIMSAGIFIVLGLFLSSTWHFLASAWHSNLAALEQSRSDLVQGIVFDINTFPTDTRVEQSLLLALELNPSNRTAFHRMGMLALRHGEYERGAKYLEEASALDPEHPGIAKALGYAYTWLGEIDRAYCIFIHFPETGYELSLYSDWWLTQDREDLAEYAAALERMLETSNTTTSCK